MQDLNKKYDIYIATTYIWKENVIIANIRNIEIKYVINFVNKEKIKKL